MDENGTVVPDADQLVQFSVSGPGKIIAVDSGSVISTVPIHAAERKVYQGRCLAIFRATGAGSVHLEAKVDGLVPASVKITGTPDQ